MTRTKVAPLAMLLGFTRAAVRHPWRVLAAAALLTAGATALATRLEIRSSFEELLPKDLPSVAQIQELSRRVGGDGNVLVNIESLDGPEGLGRAQRLAPVLARDFLAMGSHRVRSVEFDVGEIQRWYTEHWPLFATVEELTAARDGLRAEIRKRTAAANPLVVELSEDEEAPAATAAAAPPSRLVQLFDPQRPLPREQIAERFSSNVDGFLVWARASASARRGRCSTSCGRSRTATATSCLLASSAWGSRAPSRCSSPSTRRWSAT